MTKKVHYNIRVSGKVQGVWFRDSTMRKAVELNVTGFVRNEPDGSVYIEAEGLEQHVHELTEWCKIGPPRAKVAQVVLAESELKHFSAFEITR